MLTAASDVGEAFRPVVSPWIGEWSIIDFRISYHLTFVRTNVVTAAYGVSWAYLIGDVSYETYKARVRGPTELDTRTGLGESGRLSMVAVKRGM